MARALTDKLGCRAWAFANNSCYAKRSREFNGSLRPPEKISASTSDLLALGNIHDRWPQLVARAVLLAPKDMTSYVAYLPFATIDMHSDFTGNAARVCNKLPKEFRSAIADLSEED